MSTGSVQFRGVASVMKAFKNRFEAEADTGGWSIWCKNQFMFKGIGDDSLKSMLSTLYSSTSNSVYTLKIFEDAKTIKAIKEKTECDGSFNFRFHNEEGEVPNEAYITRASASSQVMAGINAINARLDLIEQLKEDEEKDKADEEKNSSSLGWVGDLIKIPGISEAIGQIIPQLIGSIIKPAAATPNYTRPGAIAGPTAYNLSEVVIELQKYDPQLMKHLNKLLTMAIEKPHNFSFLINTLDSM